MRFFGSSLVLLFTLIIVYYYFYYYSLIYIIFIIIYYCFGLSLCFVIHFTPKKNGVVFFVCASTHQLHTQHSLLVHYQHGKYQRTEGEVS